MPTITRKLIYGPHVNDNSRRTITRDSSGRLFVLTATGTAAGQSNCSIYIHYSDDDGDTWNSEVVISGQYYRVGMVIAVDSADNLHIAYSGPGAYELSYIKGTIGNWGASEQIAAQGISFDLAIDGEDVPHVVFSVTNASGRDMKHAWRENSSWPSETVFVSSTQPFSDPQLVIDDDGYLHVTYCMYNIAGDPIRYRKKITDWSDYEIAIDVSSYRNFLCIDRASIVYAVSEDRYFNQRNGSWGTKEEILYDSKEPGAFPEIAVPEDGVRWVVGNDNIFRKVNGTWEYIAGTPQDPTALVANPSVLWANYPQAGAFKTCVLASGFIFVYFDVSAYKGCWLALVDVEYSPSLPSLTTDPATDLGAVSATLNGTLDADGGEACDCGFEYGETTDYGMTTPPQSKTTGETFSQVIGGLASNTTYHFRAFATTLIISRAFALGREEL